MSSMEFNSFAALYATFRKIEFHLQPSMQHSERLTYTYELRFINNKITAVKVAFKR
jgi:hypothetical protein